MKRRAGLVIVLAAGIVATASSASPTNAYRAAIYAVRSDGSGRVLIAKPDPPIPYLVRSPGGRSILFDRSGEENALYAAELSGANRVRLTPEGLSVFAAGAAFSPDGQTIAFSSYVICGPRCVSYTLYLVRREGTGLHRVAEEASSPSWAPDGRRLAYAGRDGVYVLDVTTGQSTQVGPGSRPVWAPRGERIAYSRTMGGYGVACFVNSNGTGRRCTHGHSLTSLVWSHDGKRVAFRQATPRRLGIVDAYARKVRYLGYRGRWARPAAWSPDGRRLAYWFSAYSGSGSGRVFVLNVAGPRRPRMLFDERASMNDLRWQAGRLTYVAVRIETP